MPQARPYDVTSKLDALIDALPPESLPALAHFERLLGPVPSKTGLDQLLLQWREGLQVQDCPAALAPFARRLTELLAMLERWIDEGTPPDREAVEVLAQPEQDLLLAPALSLLRFLDQRQAANKGSVS